MTPQDVPGPIITIESLFPWLHAITPAQEPGARARAGAPAPRGVSYVGHDPLELAAGVAHGTAGVLILPPAARTASTAPPASGS
jgi:hypothetical protein